MDFKLNSSIQNVMAKHQHSRSSDLMDMVGSLGGILNCLGLVSKANCMILKR